MFDLGFSELFLIAIVALVVLGPERLPKAARFAGVWIKRARSQWQSVKSEFESQLADEELSGSLRETREQLHDVRRQLKERGESLRSDFELGSDRDRGRDDSDYDYDEEALGSASDPELKAMMESEGQPGQEPEPSPPGPEEPGPDQEEPDPDQPDQPDQPERREPGAPAPTRRDPAPGEPGDPVPVPRFDDASMDDRTDRHAAPSGSQRP